MKQRLSEPYLCLNGHARAKTFQVVLVRAEANADWHTLNHLDVVTSSVFGRQDAAAGASDGRDAFYYAFEVLLECVDVNLRALSGVHPGQLCLFEVCSHPCVGGSHEHHERLSFADAVPNLSAPLSHDSAHWSADMAKAEIQFSAA